MKNKLLILGDIKMSLSMPPETVSLNSNFFHKSEILIAYYDSLYFLSTFYNYHLFQFLKKLC